MVWLPFAQSSSYSLEAQTLFNAMTVQPTILRKTQIDTLITSLKSAGIWSKLDVLYVMAAHNAQAASLNWIDPSKFALTTGGSTVQFFPNRGYQGYGTGLLKTNWAPDPNGINFTLNDASMWLWLTKSGSGTYDLGNFASPLTEFIISTSLSVGVNQATATSVGALSGTGFLGAQRTGSSILKAWKNGVQLGSTQSTVSTSLPLTTQQINTTAANVNETAMFAWGASLTGLENSFYTSINTYMTAVTVLPRWNGNPFLSSASLNTVALGAAQLQYEYTQPWTGLSAAQIFGNNPNFNVIFTNVNATPFPGYEMVFDASGRYFVRIINNFLTNVYIEVMVPTINWADGKTHIFGATYDGSGVAAGVNLWVDGIKQTTITNKDGLAGNSIIGSGQIFNIGFQTNNPYSLYGYIYHFELSNVVRSNSYMGAFIDSSSLPSVDANHSLYYLFSEGTGTTTADTSTNNFSGTLTSANMWRP